MSDTPPENPRANSTSAAQIKLGNDRQSKALVPTLTSARRTIRSVLTSPDLLLALAPSGYNELELNKGLALVTTAQTKFTTRQEALAVATLATKARAMAFNIAKKEFAAYRTTIKDHGRDALNAELGVTGPIPNRRAKLRATARAAYNRGLTEPYVTLLSKSGFDRQRLTKALDVLDKLGAAESVRETALSTAKSATDNCNVAVNALMAWVDKLRATANVALKNRPALLELLNE